MLDLVGLVAGSGGDDLERLRASVGRDKANSSALRTRPTPVRLRVHLRVHLRVSCAPRHLPHLARLGGDRLDADVARPLGPRCPDANSIRPGSDRSVVAERRTSTAARHRAALAHAGRAARAAAGGAFAGDGGRLDPGCNRELAVRRRRRPTRGQRAEARAWPRSQRLPRNAAASMPDQQPLSLRPFGSGFAASSAVYRGPGAAWSWVAGHAHAATRARTRGEGRLAARRGADIVGALPPSK